MATIYFLPLNRPYQYQENNDQNDLIPPYVSPRGPIWSDKLFTEKLVADFYRKYEEKFGALESSRIIKSTPNLNDQYMVEALIFREEALEENEAMISLGEYITLKAAEYHLDTYLRKDPKTKKVYDLKVKYTNANIKVNKNADLKFKYSLSGNYFETLYSYKNILLSYKMELKKLTEGIFKPSQDFFLIDYNVFKKYFVRYIFYVKDEGGAITFRHVHNKEVTTSLSYNYYRKIEDINEREYSLMVGLVLYLPLIL